jgi:hypothetical protein
MKIAPAATGFRNAVSFCGHVAGGFSRFFRETARTPFDGSTETILEVM